jgi:hypothetical protein
MLPLADIAEFGKTGSTAVMLVLTPNEAGEILRSISVADGSPATVRALWGVLSTIADNDQSYDAEIARDVVNTDGRYLPRAEQAEEVAIHAEQPRNPYFPWTD